jgi:hypothetical protein
MVSFRPYPDTWDLEVSRNFVALACGEGVHHECQRKSRLVMVGRIESHTRVVTQGLQLMRSFEYELAQK